MDKYKEELNEKIDRYVDAVICSGVKLKKDDTLFIQSPVDCADFARRCVRHAYDKGAKEVFVNWVDSFCSNTRINNSPDEVLATYPAGLKQLMDQYINKDASFLWLDSPVFDKSLTPDPKKNLIHSKEQSKQMKRYRDLQTVNTLTWCIVGIPNLSWAKKVFPDKSDEAALKSLWDAIFQTVYVNDKGESNKQWTVHNNQIDEIVDALNKHQFKKLHYKNSIGTDFTVELIDGHKWAGGDASTISGKRFNANMPTEEVFVSPHKFSAEGTIVSSVPLVLADTVIKDIKMELHKGKIVKATAKTGEEMLNSYLDKDRNARYLGELALVPYDSPISNMNLLFYSTLYDENASCHIAFGSGFAECIKNGCTMKQSELRKLGLNKSNVHVDFMIGTKDLNITGITKDGKEVQIFKDGNFAN